MKKLLLLLLVVVGMSSCYVDVEDTVDNPEKETTVEIQKLPKDTVVISTDGYNLYVFDENNLVVTKTVAEEEDSFPIHIGVFLAIIAIIFLSGYAIGATH